ncbi:AAA family ATPase [Priestia aryabhattai]|nr:AAA family ATPase [Priestia aryabhattai]
MLPFEFLEEFKTLDEYMGRPFMESELAELEEAIKIGACIEELIHTGEITFVRAYYTDKGKGIFIQSEEAEKVYSLERGFPSFTKKDKGVTERLTYRELPNKESILKIKAKCEEQGIDFESYGWNIRTWRGREFLKLQISEEIFEFIGGSLQEGISTRILLENETDSVLNNINRVLNGEVISELSNSVNQDLKYPLNQILYGPPGTGKTYNTIIQAVAIIENKTVEELQNEEYEQVFTRYQELKKDGQIAFTTFHQSYGYEEFIEGIKPLMHQENTSDISYQIEAGVFKDFCENAQRLKISSNGEELEEGCKIWKVSLGGSGTNSIKEDCFLNDRIRIGFDREGRDFLESREYPSDTLYYFYEEMSIGDIVFSLGNNKHIDAIGIIVSEAEWLDDESEYKRSRQVKWIAKHIWEDIYELNGNKIMVQQTIYPLSRLSLDDVNELIAHYSENSEVELEKNEKNYVFIIDEINRGNISKIFGELITLIEPSKRLRASEELRVKLPYSKKEFGVPKNVYIIGTMNTADRSIALMDTALRRRFDFIEMMPNADIFENVNVNGINIKEMLETINKRIEVLYDREHTIGHAYLMRLMEDASIETLGHIFEKAFIPLLQEYFYEDYEKIQLILGDKDKPDQYKFIVDNEIRVNQIFKGNIDIDIPEKNYTIQKEAFLKEASYKGIYQSINSDNDADEETN